MRCFSIGAINIQNDANLESFGTTEEIISSLTRLPSKTNFLPSHFLFSSKILDFPSLVFLLLLKENILSQILNQLQIFIHRKLSNRNKTNLSALNLLAKGT